MSRIKTYYNDNEIVTDLYTFGKEWQLQDGTEYVGLYHKYISTQEVYTNPVWNISLSKKLIKYQEIVNKNTVPYKKLKPNLNVNYTVPTEIYPEPTTDDIAKTYFIRYFIKKQNQSEIIEIDKTQYDLWVNKKIDPIMYTAVSFKWYISGPLDTKINGNIKIEGVLDKNKKAVQIANRTILGITTIFTTYNQFYTDTDFIIPPDINSKNTGTTSTTKNRNTQQNKTILDETGKLASDELAKIITNTAYISVLATNDLTIKTVTPALLSEPNNTEKSGLQLYNELIFSDPINNHTPFKPLRLIPITKYIDPITTKPVIHDYLNTTGYVVKMSNRFIGTIESDTSSKVVYNDDGTVEVVGRTFTFTPNESLYKTEKDIFKRRGNITITGKNNQGKPLTVQITIDYFGGKINYNTEIFDETGKLATDELAEQIKKTAFIDVSPTSYNFTKNDVTKPIKIKPVTKYRTTDGTIITNPYLNRNGYSFILNNRNVATIVSDSITQNRRDGSSITRGVVLEIEPKDEVLDQTDLIITSTDAVLGINAKVSIIVNTVNSTSIPGTTQTNKTIFDENGILATDELAKIITDTAFIDVLGNKTYSYTTTDDFNRKDTILPITKYIKDGKIIENQYLNQLGYIFIEPENIVNIDTENNITYEDAGILQPAGTTADISPIPVLPATKTSSITIKGINKIGTPAIISITVGKGPETGPGPTPPAPPDPGTGTGTVDDPTKTSGSVNPDAGIS